MKGEIDAPTVPIMLVHPKLNDVIYAGYISAINTKNTPHTAFNANRIIARTIISIIYMKLILLSLSESLSNSERIPIINVEIATIKKDTAQ